eukprot:s4660_g3.t1
MERRMKAIGDIIARTEPDLIAFQEMTPAHWDALSSHEVIKMYSWSDPPRQRYYTLIGSRSNFEIVNTFERFPFKASRMGRDLLKVTVKPPDLPALVFATSHLESLDEYQARRRQIQESLDGHLNDAEDAIFCGDTNINDALDGDVLLPKGWKDAWLVLRPEDEGFTFDVARNSMVAEMDDWAFKNQARLRYDRFWIKVSNYAPVAIELLDEQIEEKLWPSDHFAVLLSMEEWRQHYGDKSQQKSQRDCKATGNAPVCQLWPVLQGRMLPVQLQVGLLQALVLRLARAERPYLRQDGASQTGAAPALAKAGAPEIRARRARNITVSALCRVHERCKEDAQLQGQLGEAASS